MCAMTLTSCLDYGKKTFIIFNIREWWNIIVHIFPSSIIDHSFLHSFTLRIHSWRFFVDSFILPTSPSFLVPSFLPSFFPPFLLSLFSFPPLPFLPSFLPPLLPSSFSSPLPSPSLPPCFIPSFLSSLSYSPVCYHCT